MAVFVLSISWQRWSILDPLPRYVIWPASIRLS